MFQPLDYARNGVVDGRMIADVRSRDKGKNGRKDNPDAKWIHESVPFP
jgi:hypothetical protein